jgi:hypothetical protein
MAHPATYDDGTTELTFSRPKGIRHTVSANEESSGLVNITFFQNPTGSDEVMFIPKIADSTGVLKEGSGVVMDYRPTSGIVRVECAPGYLVENDTITIIGMRYV